MDEEGDDPFASLIIPNCQTTSSQEDFLQRSRFAGETPGNPPSKSSDSSADEEEPRATPIVLISLSDDSQNDQNTSQQDGNENFQTPPEHSNSLHSCNDELTPPPLRPPNACDPNNAEGGVGEAKGVDEGGADLSKDTHTFELSHSKVNIEIDGRLDGGKVMKVSEDESGRFGGLDDENGLSRVCLENFGEGALNDTIVVEEGQIEIENAETEIVELDTEEVYVGLGDGLVGNAPEVSDRMTVIDAVVSVCASEHENVSMGKPVRGLEKSDHIGESRIEIKNMIMENVEVTLEEVGVGLTDELMENVPNVSDRMTVRDEGMNACFSEHGRISVEKPDRELKEIDRIGKCSGMVDIANVGLASKRPVTTTEGRRELPFSLRPQEKNVGEDSTSVKKRLLKDILDGLKLVMGEVGDEVEGVDILETAKRRGLTFPRPRWWHPETFDV